MSFENFTPETIHSDEPWLQIITSQQTLAFRIGNNQPPLIYYTVSTSRYGLGEESGSYRTPRGWHKIAAKIGHDAPWGTHFKARKPTGKIWPQDFHEADEEDLILTRILWLSGLESHNTNTLTRYIYIHGTQDESNLGRPMSLGCIRMSNDDVIDLFHRVEEGTKIFIQ
jgi:L,D-transpeptidase YbiS